MKTTVDLPDELLMQAKIHAARERKTLKEIIETALRKELRVDEPGASGGKITIHWVTAPGGLPNGVDAADRGTWYKMMTRSS